MAGDEHPRFSDRINFQQYFAGLAASGIRLSESEKAYTQNLITSKLNDYGGNALKGDSLLTNLVLRPLYTALYAIQNTFRNADGFSFGGMLDWLKTQIGETSAGGERGMTNTAMNWIHSQMTAAGGEIARAANMTTGTVRADTGEATVNPSWNIYNQVVNYSRPLTPVQQTVGSSLNGAGDRQRYAVANATGTPPPSPTPVVIPNPALTASIQQV